ncbi:MAG: UDP-N-acetylglucosamine 1-carboxyvinyltransferase [Anaerolineae bacterium]|nr:UDP-N-acetylglucosamine 1-carboxyvinyltransferase [Anaerolineae bacterium]
MLIQVDGRHPLNGVYRPGGNPNAALALMAAALLTEEKSILRNVPHTLTTQALALIAEELGAQIDWDAGDMSLTAGQIKRRVISQEDTELSSGALLLAAPLLIRRQHVRLEIDFPLNRIRTHLEALRDLGIDVVTPGSAVELNVTFWDKKDILLTQASVTATALVMMLAARLGKHTTIRNAATEPHVQELAHLLVAMGAHVEGIGSNILSITGTESLKGGEAAIGPNHIEVGSIAAIAAMCGGRVQIEGIRRADLRMIVRIFRRFGIQIDMDEANVYIPSHEGLSISNREEDVDASIESAPWPGFPSDLVAVATVVATQTVGTSLIHEKMFANRLLFVDKLKAMGAQIVLCDPHRAIVVGPSQLMGGYMDTPDIRAGLGMLAAALVAEGVTQIDNSQVLAHTFGDVLDKLTALGARINPA